MIKIACMETIEELVKYFICMKSIFEYIAFHNLKTLSE